MKFPSGRASRIGPPLAVTVLAAAYLASASGAASAGNNSAAVPVPAQLTCQHTDKKPTVQIASAKLFIEYNATDDDTGIHGAFDDDGWSRLCVFDPNGDQVLAVNPQSQLRDLTMGGIFFESREPPRSELTFAELAAAFPAGRYTVRGTSFDGQQLVGSAIFTHNVPAAPVITAPPLTDGDAPATHDTVPIEGLMVTWEDVTHTVDGRPVTITGYEVIITKAVEEDPNGFSTPTFDVHVTPDSNSLSVPVEFLEPNTEYELEVLALEVSGNQTISVGFFTTG
ncbi:MAG: hypothetical protein ACR2JK_03150 [Geodermatophilaceae bacterium]